ncbi:MAG: hypothetical protein CO146_00605 [Candidatus Nealsonbacteria bacterium CG_4_9_14_3_um_filter_37_29]|uniref:Uncharacterized protein n=1 Tax=Candidatus Nealsonbacteria bacterium CG_4_9_14_3_um_filter_37_29 TaxID=1974696 RepID=A0A2M7Z3T8_9BACT|nr:MAG: hypothetical protein CO146_00605 [Candidatus Nealsonbacteria bacterium CG_4_9_14_3_um_filter_37_29]
MKKIFLIIFLGVLLFPSLSLAYTVYQTEGGVNVIYKGIVPCGKPVNLGGDLSNGDLVGGTCCEMPCTFCHFFVMLDGAIDFVLLKLVPPIAILMLVIGGVMFILGYFGEGGEGSPKLFSQGKKLITSVFIGLIIIFAAWLIINLFFQFIGVADWTGLQQGWFRINCPTNAEVCTDRLVSSACEGVRAAGKIPCATLHHNGQPIDASECLE